MSVADNLISLGIYPAKNRWADCGQWIWNQMLKDPTKYRQIARVEFDEGNFFFQAKDWTGQNIFKFSDEAMRSAKLALKI